MATDADECDGRAEASVSSGSSVCKSDLFISMDETSSAVAKTKLRPAPLFRTVGLTGLSASLPPHRRLRSVLQSTSDQPHPNPHHKHIQTQDRPLPKIYGQTDNELSMKKHLTTAGAQRRHCGRRINTTGVEKEEYLFEEVWREKGTKLKNNCVKVDTRQNEASELSQWMQKLEIIDRKQERTTKRHRTHLSGRVHRAGPVIKEAGQLRRDRRPHFLPPITQSDCLLNVPLLLPDNSPPPSPCSPSDVLFFPLSVPHIQPFPGERRADTSAQHHRGNGVD